MTRATPALTKWAWALPAFAAATLALTSCTPAQATFSGPASMSPGEKAALTTLESIPVKGRAPKTGYTRDQFGSAWADTDHNGCDTRNDILRRDLTSTTVKPGTKDCVILSGHLQDAYTGKSIDFQRGGASEVDIDHRVPLSDAWQKGAQLWDADKRTRFANDPINLAAVDSTANRQKGDSDLATWLPPDRASWCGYTAAIVQVKATYGLWMTPAEHDKAHEILNNCH